MTRAMSRCCCVKPLAKPLAESATPLAAACTARVEERLTRNSFDVQPWARRVRVGGAEGVASGEGGCCEHSVRPAIGPVARLGFVRRLLGLLSHIVGGALRLEDVRPALGVNASLELSHQAAIIGRRRIEVVLLGGRLTADGLLHRHGAHGVNAGGCAQVRGSSLSAACKPSPLLLLALVGRRRLLSDARKDRPGPQGRCARRVRELEAVARCAQQQ